jgi:exopolyphosphatase / guanosine-5'-triphosphate,3'-diphosphate pyrophosphatase
MPAKSVVAGIPSVNAQLLAGRPTLWEHPRVAAPGRALEADDHPFAVMDVGSNSARMIVFRLREGEHLDVIEDARAPLRLARELRSGGKLGARAIERTVDALRDFRAVADGAGATRMIAVATSAVRDATDGRALVERARAIGVPLEIIDGDTEARLGFLGAVHDLPVTSGATLDVGGGSAELTLFHDRRLEGSWMFELGSLRLSDRFLEHDPPTDSDIRKLRSHVAGELRSGEIAPLSGDGDLVGIGGTVRNLAKVDMRRTENPLHLLHGYELMADRLDAVIRELGGRSMKRRAQLPGLNPDRADSVLGGALVVDEVMAWLKADRVIISSRGIREGLALADAGGSIPPPRFVRSISVATLAARFATWDAGAAERRVGLAARLHAALDPEARAPVGEMLEHAATMLDLGRAIDYYQRFEHAAMIATAADLAGFSHEALAILTGILRQADDDARLGPYRRLVSGQDRPSVLRAATTLALADELNRRIPPGIAASLSTTWGPGAFVVVAPVPGGWQPRGIADRFRRAFGRPLHVVAIGEGP